MFKQPIPRNDLQESLEKLFPDSRVRVYTNKVDKYFENPTTLTLCFDPPPIFMCNKLVIRYANPDPFKKGKYKYQKFLVTPVKDGICDLHFSEEPEKHTDIYPNSSLVLDTEPVPDTI